MNKIDEKREEIEKLKLVLKSTNCYYTSEKLMELQKELSLLIIEKLRKVQEEINGRG